MCVYLCECMCYHLRFGVCERVRACAAKLYTVFETKQVIKFADQRPGIKVNLLTRNVKYQM